MSELHELADYLERSAAGERREGVGHTSDYCQGLSAGIANGYELAALWLREILAKQGGAHAGARTPTRTEDHYPSRD